MKDTTRACDRSGSFANAADPVADEAPTADSAPERGSEGPPSEQDVAAMLAAASFRRPFGPDFFLTQLRAYVRDRCPEPGDALPVVELRLVDGAVLDLCHVIGVAPEWVALAVNDDESREPGRTMRTDFVPYGTIVRVTIRPSRPDAPGIGFSHMIEPTVLGRAEAARTTAESVLSAAAGFRPIE